MREPENPIEIVAVKYWGPDWYTKVIDSDGRVIHYGPWKTEWAAKSLAHSLSVKFAHKRRRQLDSRH